MSASIGILLVPLFLIAMYNNIYTEQEHSGIIYKSYDLDEETHIILTTPTLYERIMPYNFKLSLKN